MTESAEHAEWRKEFESKLEADIRLLAEHNGATVTVPDKVAFARAWLKQLESDRRAKIDLESLAISKEANRIAELALKRAKIAGIWAGIAALIAAIAIYVSVFIGKS
jgi:hypothetical protein